MKYSNKNKKGVDFMSSYKLPKEQILRIMGITEEKDGSTLYYETLKDLSNVITSYRKENGITNKQLADMSGITTSVMSRVESGYQNISLSTICKVLNNIGMKIKIVKNEE